MPGVEDNSEGEKEMARAEVVEGESKEDVVANRVEGEEGKSEDLPLI